MNIESAQYYNDGFGNIGGIMATIDGQKISIPLDPANRHYAAILEWVDDGNTIQEAD